MEGPHAGLDEACGDDGVVVGDHDGTGLAEVILAPMGTFQSALVLGCLSGPFGQHRVVLEGDGGAYFSVFTIITNSAVSGAQTSMAEVSQFALKQIIPGGPPELLLRVDATYASGGASPDWYENSVSELYVCGVGPSGVPSCTEAIPVKRLASAPEEASASNFEFSVEMPERGGILLRPLPEYSGAKDFLQWGLHEIRLP